LTRIRTAVAVLAIALPIIAIVAGCGGGSSSNSEDPQQVLDQTFNNPTKISSGKLDLSISGSAEGQQSGNFSATISGPFQTDPSDKTAFPQLDLTANVSGSQGGPSISFDGSLIATKDNAYVEYQNQAYEVGTAAFQQFATAYAKAAKQNQANGSSSGFSQFGIDPKTWLTNVSNEGTTDIDGTNTIHIHGDADVSKIVTDLQKVSQQTSGSTQQISPDQLKQLTDAVQTASIDVYSNADNHLLTKLAVSLAIAPPSSAGSTVSKINVNFSLTLSDVNQPQTITGPSNAKPIADLLSQLGIPGLGLPGVGGTTGGFPVPGGGSSSGAGSSSSSYQNCVAQAKSQADIQKCLQQL
jgi:hypothetical protein